MGLLILICIITLDSKVYGANMGLTWVLTAPDGPHVGPMNLAIRDREGEIWRAHIVAGREKLRTVHILENAIDVASIKRREVYSQGNAYGDYGQSCNIHIILAIQYRQALHNCTFQLLSYWSCSNLNNTEKPSLSYIPNLKSNLLICSGSVSKHSKLPSIYAGLIHKMNKAKQMKRYNKHSVETLQNKTELTPCCGCCFVYTSVSSIHKHFDQVAVHVMRFNSVPHQWNKDKVCACHVGKPASNSWWLDDCSDVEPNCETDYWRAKMEQNCCQKSTSGLPGWRWKFK